MQTVWMIVEEAGGLNAVSSIRIENPPFQRLIIEMLPEILFTGTGDEPPAKLLKPMFDGLWNAAGLDRCPYYGKDGQWDIDENWLDDPDRPY